ncbi:MAG: hypothetical protein AABY22_21170, partial [Nanoarchaeota archaeon]
MVKLNYRFEEKDSRDIKFSSIDKTEYLPFKIDRRAEFDIVLNQQSLGSCVAHSVAICIRHVFNKQKKGNFIPSRLYIYYNGRTDKQFDTGLTIRDGYKSVEKFSACRESAGGYIPDRSFL